MSPERVHQLVERLGNLLRADARRLGASHGLLPVHVHALVYLYRCNVLSNNPSAVSEYLGITKGTASQTLLRLEEKGLLRREADPDDARSVRLELTSRGRKLAREVSPSPLVREALAELGDAGTGLEESLEALLRSLQRANGSRSFGVCHTCRHFVRSASGARCALTGEALRVAERAKICREHEPAGSGARS